MHRGRLGSSAIATFSLSSPFTTEFAIGLDESVAFARLSGDYNPLHIDPILARRIQFGGTVAHGIHVLLKALDGLSSAELPGGFEPLAIACTFSNPIPTDSAVRIDATRDAATGLLRIIGKSADRLAFSATIDLRRNLAARPYAADDTDFGPASPRIQALPLANHEGATRIQLSRARLSQLFPCLATRGDLDWIANLLATTRIVGMECPGMHSIYSGVKLQRSEEPGSPTIEWMRYRVERSDQRFRMIRMSVMGAGFGGTIEAFLRPPPMDQMLLTEVAGKVAEGTLAGQRALVIGGSRGLGELTAKILIAGGADATITYATGREDAERILEEASTLGRRCAMVQLDVAAPIDNDSARWLTASAFSHIYYFASPHISKNAAGRWNHELFERFCSIYVQAFASVSEVILSGAKGQHRPARFFFPSTAFLDHPENGFAEYCAAKAAGESLAAYLAHKYRAVFARPRLPRMRTDQTSGLPDADAEEPFAIMHPILIEFHATPADPRA